MFKGFLLGEKIIIAFDLIQRKLTTLAGSPDLLQYYGFHCKSMRMAARLTMYSTD